MSSEVVFFYVLSLLSLYQYALFIYILLTWLPSVHETMIFKFFETLSEPFFRVFRGWLRFGTLDLTPVFGLILYGLLLNFVRGNLQ
jgi:YggT family protein